MMSETINRNRYHHCMMLFNDLCRWKPDQGDTRGGLFIDEAEHQILMEIVSAELAAINRIDPESARYWANCGKVA